MLLVRQPRWPLQNTLLVLRSDLSGETAVYWVNPHGKFVRKSPSTHMTWLYWRLNHTAVCLPGFLVNWSARYWTGLTGRC